MLPVLSQQDLLRAYEIIRHNGTHTANGYQWQQLTVSLAQDGCDLYLSADGVLVLLQGQQAYLIDYKDTQHLSAFYKRLNLLLAHYPTYPEGLKADR